MVILPTAVQHRSPRQVFCAPTTFPVMLTIHNNFVFPFTPILSFKASEIVSTNHYLNIETFTPIQLVLYSLYLTGHVDPVTVKQAPSHWHL